MPTRRAGWASNYGIGRRIGRLARRASQSASFPSLGSAAPAPGTRYSSPSHRPRSMIRHRREQNGKSGYSCELPGIAASQMGHRTLLIGSILLKVREFRSNCSEGLWFSFGRANPLSGAGFAITRLRELAACLLRADTAGGRSRRTRGRGSGRCRGSGTGSRRSAGG